MLIMVEARDLRDVDEAGGKPRVAGRIKGEFMAATRVKAMDSGLDRVEVH